MNDKGFLLGSAMYPKAENEPYRGATGDEGPLDQPHDTEWYLNKMIEEKQGNLLVCWASLGKPELRPEIMKYWNRGEPLLEWAEEFKKHDLALMTFYSQGHHGKVFLDEKVVKQLKNDEQLDFIGENFGENLNKWFGSSCPQNRPNTQFKNLQEAKEIFLNEFLKPKIEKLKEMGYPRVVASSSYSFANYELEAGVDIPMSESVGCAYNVADMRGACKKWGRKAWGMYVNHDWYTRHIPYHAQQKYDLLEMLFYQLWMSGAGIVTLESGNLWTEGGHYTKDSTRNYPFEHEYCQSYRKVMRDFYYFTQNNQRPEPGPTVKTCFALGNLDGFNGQFDMVNHEGQYSRHRFYTFGMCGNAKNDFNYLYGDPEYAWDIFFTTVYPLNKNALKPYGNQRISGSPLGQADVVGIDEKTPDELLSEYKLIVYTGWNTMTADIYEKLIQYVKQGGTLLMGLPHLSTRNDRKYWEYDAADIINQGDLSELFGVKIKGKGNFIFKAFDTGAWEDRVYPFYDYDVENESGMDWSTIPDARVEVLLGDLEMSESTEILYRNENRGQFKGKFDGKKCDGAPLFIRNKLGKGTAYLSTAWEYPGAPGLKRFYAYVVKNLMFQSSDRVFIKDIGSNRPENESANIFFSVYSDRVYLLNTDNNSKHSFELVIEETSVEITLNPKEFRIMRRDQK